MKKTATLALCILFVLTFSAMAQDAPDTQLQKDQSTVINPSQSDPDCTMSKAKKMSDCPMMKKCAKMTPEQKQEMMKNCPMMKKCSKTNDTDVTPDNN